MTANVAVGLNDVIFFASSIARAVTLASIDDFFDQADPQRGVRIDRIAGEQQPHRLPDADEAGQHLRRTATAEPASGDLRTADFRAAAGNTDIGCERNLHAPAKHPPFQGSDDRFTDIADQSRVFDAIAKRHEVG